MVVIFNFLLIRYKLKTYLIVIFFLLCKLADATHIVGGEIYYDYLGGDNYRIHMKVYRDCLNGVPPFDGFPDSQGGIINAVYTIYDDSNNVIVTGIFTPLSFSTVPPTSIGPCVPVLANYACVEEALYETYVTLPPKTGGYYIAYQRCCRNSTILNLVNPGGVGATYWEHIPGPEKAVTNNSPRFVNRPPIYICRNQPIAFDHVATDPDGDSLVYTLCDPYNGLDGCCPVVANPPFAPNNSSSQCFIPVPSCPFINTAPPYLSVPFASPYSSSYPMSSNPAININSSTGFLNGVPNILGQWVVGVCVDEYRHGVLIATHHRDFQFNVINCVFDVKADIVSQITTNNGEGTGFCNGFTITYANSSQNESSWYWDFGDTLSVADTSNVENPSYTFSIVGVYTVMLVANPRTICADTTYEVFQVHPLLVPDYITPVGQCMNGNSFDFNATGQYEGNGIFSWDFGLNASPQSASTISVTNVSFNSPGDYPVVLTISENGCTASATKTIQVWQSPDASVGTFPTIGCNPLLVNFNNTSTSGTPMDYLWTFSDGTTSTLQDPTHVFSPAGIYSFTLSVITHQNCIDTSHVFSVNSITVTTTPLADFTYVSATGLCFDSNNFSFTDATTLISPSGTISWSFDPDASVQTSSNSIVPNVSFGTLGTHSITLIATDDACVDTITKTIELYENPVATINPVISLGCDPMMVTFSNGSTAASNMSYLWNFSDGSNSTDENPVRYFSPAGIYTYTLTVYTDSKCIDTTQAFSVSSITVNPSPVASFTANPMVTSIFDPDVFFFNTSASEDIITWYYNFDDGTGSDDVNPMHTYATWGDYTVTQTVTNVYACSNTMKLLIRVLPEFRFWVPNAFTPGNKDNLNDVFKPIVIGVEDYTFMIFDRWGELIFRTTDTEAGWNGFYKNKLCTNDVYIWKCEFKNIVSQENESHIGHVTLVR